MFEVYRYEKGSGKNNRLGHVFLSAGAAKTMARRYENRHPGQTVLYEVIDPRTGRVIWHGTPEIGWRYGDDPDPCEPW